MRRIALAGLLVPLVLLAGCAADPSQGLPEYEQPSPVGFEAVAPDDEGPRDWIRIEVHGEDRTYAFEDLNVTLVTPQDEQRHGGVCDTAAGTWADGCKDPFEAGETVASGGNLWLPCAGPGSHRVTVELGATEMVDGPADCQAAAGSSGPEDADVRRNLHDADDDGEIEWLELVLESGDNAPYAADEVLVEAEAPDETTREDRACQTAEGTWADGCQDPFDGEERWSEVASLFVPCQDRGDHRVTVTIRGTTQLDAGFFCEAGA